MRPSRSRCGVFATPLLPGLRAVCTLPVIEDFFLRILLLYVYSYLRYILGI